MPIDFLLSYPMGICLVLIGGLIYLFNLNNKYLSKIQTLEAYNLNNHHNLLALDKLISEFTTSLEDLINHNKQVFDKLVRKILTVFVFEYAIILQKDFKIIAKSKSNSEDVGFIAKYIEANKKILLGSIKDQNSLLLNLNHENKNFDFGLHILNLKNNSNTKIIIFVQKLFKPRTNHSEEIKHKKLLLELYAKDHDVLSRGVKSLLIYSLRNS